MSLSSFIFLFTSCCSMNKSSVLWFCRLDIHAKHYSSSLSFWKYKFILKYEIEWGNSLESGMNSLLPNFKLECASNSFFLHFRIAHSDLKLERIEFKSDSGQFSLTPMFNKFIIFKILGKCFRALHRMSGLRN